MHTQNKRRRRNEYRKKMIIIINWNTCLRSVETSRNGVCPVRWLECHTPLDADSWLRTFSFRWPNARQKTKNMNKWIRREKRNGVHDYGVERSARSGKLFHCLSSIRHRSKRYIQMGIESVYLYLQINYADMCRAYGHRMYGLSLAQRPLHRYSTSRTSHSLVYVYTCCTDGQLPTFIKFSDA